MRVGPRVAAAAFCLLGLVMPAAAHAASPDAPPAGRGLDRALARVVAAGAPGALVAVDGPGATTAATGVDDRRAGRRMSARDHFRAGSVTKAFVATVLLQLAERHRLRLDDPVGRYLPGELRDGGHITLRELAHMSSGVYDYIDDLPGDTRQEFRRNRQRTFAPAELVRLAERHPAGFPPGHGWGYSNTNYIVLGQVIEKVTGHSLSSEIQRRITRPLGLRGTLLPVTSPTLPTPAMRGYHPDGASSSLFDATAQNPSAYWATGALVTDAQDLNTFFGALLSGRLLDRESMRAMEAVTSTGWPVVPTYGLGLIRRDLPCGVSVWGHSGIVEGYLTLSFATADGSRRTTVAANTSNNTNAFNAMVDVLTEAYCGPEARTSPVSPRDLSRYHA
jgi:D-alanyl-D-alanine carboxypeptidase